MILNKFYVDDVIKNALLEDVNYVDQATAFVIPETSVSMPTGTVSEFFVQIGAWFRNAYSCWLPRARRRCRSPESRSFFHEPTLFSVTVVKPFVFHARPIERE